MVKRPQKISTYAQIIENIFFDSFVEGIKRIPFHREQFEPVAKKLNIKLPKNQGDITYSFKYRVDMPQSILSTAPDGKTWIIRSEGTSLYVFVLVIDIPIKPNPMMAAVKIPNATPGLVIKYAFNDEQALLTRLRYNRLLDIFTGTTCYSLQNHLRTRVNGIGQVETDEIYVGVDQSGTHYIFPVQAKGKKDKIGIVQIEQDFALCRAKFPDLICRPVAAQFTQDNLIALFEFRDTEDGPRITTERHYRLVDWQDITPDDLELYRRTINLSR